MTAAPCRICTCIAVSAMLTAGAVNAESPSNTKAETRQIQYELKRLPKLDATLAPVYSWSARVEMIPGQLVGLAPAPADMLTLQQLSTTMRAPTPKWNEWAPEADFALASKQITAGVAIEALSHQTPGALPLLHTVTESLPPAPAATPMPLRSAVLNAEASTYSGPEPQLVIFSKQRR